MYRTLSKLRDSINQMIKRQGEDAGYAAFVFTQHDVFEFNEETNQDDYFSTLFTQDVLADVFTQHDVFEFNEETNQDNYFSTLFTQDVLADVGDSSYIYEQVGKIIDDAIRLRMILNIVQEERMYLFVPHILNTCKREFVKWFKKLPLFANDHQPTL